MTSVLDLFTIGIGPSSSHTVGPMRAARRFLDDLRRDGLSRVAGVKITLYGSLGATGRGHGSDGAVILGLMGADAETVCVDAAPDMIARVREHRSLPLGGEQPVPFDEDKHLKLRPGKRLPFHVNGLRFEAFDDDGACLLNSIYYSVGGGFVVSEHEAEADAFDAPTLDIPYPFSSGVELLDHCARKGLSIAEIMRANEEAGVGRERLNDHLDRVAAAMRACVERGWSMPGEMPGLGVKRRAPELKARLDAGSPDDRSDPLTVMDWVNLFALSVNEENATGGRVVTAPTNGAAGIIPAVLEYFRRFRGGEQDVEAIRDFLLTAGAVGKLFKENASISGAEVGCQGEVGSACAMAAAGLAAVKGGTPSQVENAAEIGMEHNLGLTCDPIGGLVQVPCIERNAMGAVKAINAARLALKGDGTHFVSLDKVIRTMRITGRDMKTQYKETAKGGLAAVVPIAATVVDC